MKKKKKKRESSANKSTEYKLLVYCSRVLCTHPILPLQTSLAAFFSKKAPTFCSLLRRVLA